MNKSTLETLYWTPMGIVLIFLYEKFSNEKTVAWYAKLGIVHGLYGILTMYIIKLLFYNESY